MQKTAHSRGFTLVELMVTVAIMVILTTLAAPSMRQFIGNWQVSNAVNAFMGSMQLARAEAVKKGRSVRMCRSSNGRTCGTGNNLPGGWNSGWIVYIDSDGSSTNVGTGDTVVYTQNALDNFDGITSNNPSAIVYSPTGLLKGGVGMQAMTFNWDADGQIKKTLCINFTGRAFIAASSADCR
jgi:type IV fimbrial biogenesis protein FimT